MKVLIGVYLALTLAGCSTPRSNAYHTSAQSNPAWNTKVAMVPPVYKSEPQPIVHPKLPESYKRKFEEYKRKKVKKSYASEYAPPRVVK